MTDTAIIKMIPVEDIGVEHVFSDHEYAKRVTLKPGQWIGKHVHNYTHLSILAAGHVLVDAGGEITEYTAPAHVVIKAHVPHTVFAPDGAVWYCIHATDEKDPEKIDEVIVEGRQWL